MYEKTLKKCWFWWQKYCMYMYVYDILILGFEITKKTFFVKIEVCGKNVRFLNLSEKKRDFIFALFSRHFISLFWYSKRRSELYQRKNLCYRNSRKFNKSQNFLMEKSWILTWIWAKIQWFDIFDFNFNKLF